MVADAQLVQLYGTDLEPADAEPTLGAAPRTGATAHGEARPDGVCVELRPDPTRAAGATPSVAVTMPDSGLLVRAGGESATVEVRRFAGGYTHTAHDLVAPSGNATLRFPPDAAPQPWQARVRSQGRVSVCGLR